MERIHNLLQRGNLEDVLRDVDKQIEHFSNVLGMVLVNAGHDEVANQASRLKSLSKSGFLNIAHERVNRALKLNQSNFVTNLIRQQRSILRNALIDGYRQGESNLKLGERFKNAVGLSDQQAAWLATYRRTLFLSRSAPITQAAHYTVTIIKADETDGLSEQQIDRMLGTYARKLKRDRASTIGATDGLSLINQGRFLAVKQVLESTDAGGTKTWLHTTAKEPRLTHLAVVGDTVGIDEAFDVGGVPMMYPGDSSLGAGPEDLINCQCGVSYDVTEGA